MSVVSQTQKNMRDGDAKLMSQEINLERRLEHIENICTSYMQTPGFPKNVVMNHVIKVARGEIKIEEE